jgi:hypothetical protein
MVKLNVLDRRHYGIASLGRAGYKLWSERLQLRYELYTSSEFSSLNRVSSPASVRFAINRVKPRPSTPPAAPEEDNVKTLTADELFALLPHHSLALIGKPGNQQLICLDQPVADAARTAPTDH